MLNLGAGCSAQSHTLFSRRFFTLAMQATSSEHQEMHEEYFKYIESTACAIVAMSIQPCMECMVLRTSAVA